MNRAKYAKLTYIGIVIPRWLLRVDLTA